jgi:hypothetical protein
VGSVVIVEVHDRVVGVTSFEIGVPRLDVGLFLEEDPVELVHLPLVCGR